MKRFFIWLVFFCVPAGMKADAIYYFSLDTSALIPSPAGQFWISFQMSDGSGTGDGNNAAVLSKFQFGAGLASGSPLLIGSAFGDLSTGVILTDASGLAFFAQPFEPGTDLHFQLDLTTNVDSGPIPDAFTFSILDNTLTSIPTTAGPGLDTLAEIDIVSDNPIVTVFPGDISRHPAGGGPPIAISAPSVTTVPEPVSWQLLSVGLVAIILRALKR